MIWTGKLNKRIIFQRMEIVEDDMGQSRSEWRDFKSAWATVKPYKSSETGFMGKLKPEVTHRIYIRFRPGITSEMRIKYRNRIFEIAGPPLDIEERHELLEIQATEVFENE